MPGKSQETNTYVTLISINIF